MRFSTAIVVGLCFALTSASHAQDVITNSEGHECDMDGTATSAKGKALNLLKNRHVAPQHSDIDAGVDLAAILAPGDDVDRFDEAKGAKITGLVVAVKVGGKETCNCGATESIDRDTHIELALSEDAPNTQRVIVEVTPRLRAMMGDEWRTESLRDPHTGIKGKWVEITGWLMFDTMHVNEAENTNPGNDSNWRATCWEIHPVTAFKVLDGPPHDWHALHPQLFRKFQEMQATDLQRSAEKRANLKTRNDALLAEFDPDEREEDHPE